MLTFLSLQARHYLCVEETMPQTKEEERETYRKWREANPNYYRDRRKALGEELLEKERVRDRLRSKTDARKEYNRAFRKNSPRSENYKSRKRARDLAKRAELRGALVVELVFPEEVFSRGQFICKICDKRCPPDAKVPNPDAPTVDHIVAISKGGDHSYENTQCLCFMCNCTKGAR